MAGVETPLFRVPLGRYQLLVCSAFFMVSYWIIYNLFKSRLSGDSIKGLILRRFFDWTGNWSGAAPLPRLVYPVAAVEDFMIKT